MAREHRKPHGTLVEPAGNAEVLRSRRDPTERIPIIGRLDFVEPVCLNAAYGEYAKILRALLARCAAVAELPIRAHVDASRVEIRHITLAPSGHGMTSQPAARSA